MRHLILVYILITSQLFATDWNDIDSLKTVTSWGDSVYKIDSCIVYSPSDSNDLKYIYFHYTETIDTVIYHFHIWVGDDTTSNKQFELYGVWIAYSDTLRVTYVPIEIYVNKQYFQLKVVCRYPTLIKTIYSDIFERNKMTDFQFKPQNLNVISCQD